MSALAEPKFKKVNRSELRQKQKATLRLVHGSEGLIIQSDDEESEKVVLDRKYFEQIQKHLQNVVETLEITMDQRLFKQILAAADTLEEDLRLGKLHSLEDAFAED
jgi:hypothetical protein